MRICIPTVDDTGIDARLSPHFGSAPFFTLVDESGDRAEVVVNEHARHEHGGCRPTASLTDRALDVVLCRGIGRGAHARLTAAGLRVYITEAWTIREALDALQAGLFAEVRPEQLCQGHHH